MRALPLISLSLLLSPALALAQTSADLASRQELVARAEQARAAGDHEHALDFALRAGRIRMTPSLGLMIAQEQRTLGQLVESYASALACARAAQADVNAANRASIAETCTSVARALEPALGRVLLHLPTDLPSGVSVRVADAEVPEALRDLPRVVMPGEVVVEASAPGHAAFHRSLAVPAGAVVDVSIELPAVDLTRPLAPEPRVSPGAGPWIVAGLGLASLATSGVLYALADSARSDRDAQCGAMGYCQPTALDFDASYRDMLVGTNVALGVGAALVAGGALWYVIARVRATSERTPSVAVSPTAGGVALRF